MQRDEHETGTNTVTTRPEFPLEKWNETRTEYPRDKTIHALFDEQAERMPDAVAIVCENISLTYSQLRKRANLLARHLIDLGVLPGMPVGICIERSVEMVVGIL